MEMTYKGDKFGEFCSSNEFFADLKPFRIPLQVCEVGTLVLGLVMQGLLSGLTATERDSQVEQELVSRGFGQFARIVRHRDE